jgi:hypothetical protein
MASSEDTLETISRKIKFFLRKFEDQRATLAVLLAQAKALVDQGGHPYAEGRDWDAFSVEEFERHPKEIEKLIRIGRAPDPTAAAEAIRKRDREQKKAKRALGADVGAKPALPSSGKNDKLSYLPGDEVDAFVAAWARVPSFRRDEALEKIGATRGVTKRTA